MKLSQIIDLKFQRILFLNLVVAGIVLVIYGYMVVKQTQDRATQFIQSHVSQIVQAESSAQNVAEIDREVGRVFEAWKATQDLEIRVDVFLDQKLVAHAGDLQDLGILSVKQYYNSTLPSGQNLVLEIQMSILNHVVFVSMLLSGLIGFLLLIFFTFKRSVTSSINNVTRPLEEKIEWLNQVAGSLPESIRQMPEFSDCDIHEITELDRSLHVLLSEILSLEKKVAKTSSAKARLELSEQLAHKLKGGVATLQMRVRNSDTITNKEKAALLSVVEDINQASQRFLNADGELITDGEGPRSDSDEQFVLLPVVSGVVEKKQEQWAAKKNIVLEFVPLNKLDFSVSGSKLDLEAAIGDLIDNSVEASTNGTVRITLSCEATGAVISVIDTGQGIPKHILSRLGAYRFTFGKANGNGLGLYHARANLKKMGGDLKIESDEGRGTTARITLPICQTGNTHVTSLEISEGQTVVIVDDDKLIHEAWRMKLSSFKDQIEIINIFSPSELDAWISEHGYGELGSRIYFFDYDLKDKTANGLTLIQKHDLQYESFLVTGMASATEVKVGAKNLSVRVIPKDDLSRLPIELAARIENEEMIETV